MAPLLLTNLRMMLRDRQTLFWALIFPLIFVAVFGLVDFDGAGTAELAVIDDADNETSHGIADQLGALELLEVDDSYATEQEALDAIEDGDLDYLLVLPPDLGATSGSQPPPIALYYDQANLQENELVLGVLHNLASQANISLADTPQPVQVAPVAVSARQVEYFDLVLVGLVGMGLMVHSVIALGVKVSGYRSLAIFKRIRVTPLPVRNYFVSEVLAHLLLALVQTAVILAVGIWVFGGNLGGNWWLIFPIAALGNVVFLNLGFIVASFSNSGAAASGMGNAITLPLMFLSGVFWASESLPSFMPDIVRFLPLTPMLDAMRDVAIYDTSLWATWPELALLAGWIALTAAVAVRVFRFG